MYEASVIAASRQITLTGAHPTYLNDLNGRDLDQAPLATIDIPQGAICLDVGANIGATAIPLAVRRPDLRIIAFEPVPSNAAFLRRNIQRNGISNVAVIEAAVGSTPGSIRIIDNGPWSVVTDGGGVSVPLVRLDDVVSAPAALLKIDAEGYEPNVLAGAARLLSGRPLVLTEFNSWALIRQHYDPMSFAAALYSCFDVSAAFHHDLPVETPADPLALVHTNIIAHGCVTDLLLRSQKSLPPLADMTRFGNSAQLQAEIDAVMQSTSWRITAPMRWLGHKLRRWRPTNR